MTNFRGNFNHSTQAKCIDRKSAYYYKYLTRLQLILILLIAIGMQDSLGIEYCIQETNTNTTNLSYIIVSNA